MHKPKREVGSEGGATVEPTIPGAATSKDHRETLTTIHTFQVQEAATPAYLVRSQNKTKK